MNYSRISEALIVITTVVIVGYDLLPALNDVNDDTISERIRLLTERWWCLPAMWSVLAGHWWGPFHAPVVTHGGWMLAALGVLALFACALGPWRMTSPISWTLLCHWGFWAGALMWAVQVNE